MVARNAIEILALFGSVNAMQAYLHGVVVGRENCKRVAVCNLHYGSRNSFGVTLQKDKGDENKRINSFHEIFTGASIVKIFLS